MGWLKDRREKFYDGAIWVPKPRVYNWFVYVAAYIARPVVKLWTRYTAKGLENVPEEGGPYVYACNHVSFMDPLVMWSILYAHRGGSRFLARTSLFKPILGGWIARGGAIPVDPDSADRTSVKRAAACLKRGENVLIFPEGTRMNRPDKVYRPHAGVVLIAQMGKAQIVPVGIEGTQKIMPYGKPFVRFPHVYVNFGEPIDPKGPEFADVPKRERSKAVLDTVMDEIYRLRGSAKSEKKRR